MDKIICDLCGTSYPDTASQCPICGTARTDASKQQAADMTADSYAYVRGGRFSKSNVRKRNAGQTQTRRSNASAPERRRQPQAEEDTGSNRGLVIVVVILLLAIIGMCAFIAVKFLNLRNSGAYHSTSSTQSTNAALVQIPCTGVSVDQRELEFTALNKTILLQATVEPGNTTDPIIFESSDPNVVKVDADGLVTPVADGEAVITIRCGDFEAQCTVTCRVGVTPPETEPPATEPPATEPPATEPSNPPAVQFSLNRKEFTLSGAGSTWNLTLYSEDPYHPGVNYVGPSDPSAITWRSEDPSVATVENGVVTAVGNGYTYIVAEYNGMTFRCKVICKNI